MGAIKYATSNSTDEEYGGVYSTGEQINATNKNANVIYADIIKNGNVVTLQFYNGSGLISANTRWFSIPSEARPTSEKFAMAWLPTDNSSFGSKTFTVKTDGDVVCNTDVLRGGITMSYLID